RTGEKFFYKFSLRFLSFNRAFETASWIFFKDSGNLLLKTLAIDKIDILYLCVKGRRIAIFRKS
ncbi:hypothetical protein, partial [Sporolactobacillus sp. KGMB 08714]|uniref:hypothetical protein n=1 Tax=Sporolactobacillus sp. KGMB 08714 TaxID=3064704 RepID=UPI002FBEB2D6